MTLRQRIETLPVLLDRVNAYEGETLGTDIDGCRVRFSHRSYKSMGNVVQLSVKGQRETCDRLIEDTSKELGADSSSSTWRPADRLLAVFCNGRSELPHPYPGVAGDRYNPSPNPRAGIDERRGQSHRPTRRLLLGRKDRRTGGCLQCSVYTRIALGR